MHRASAKGAVVFLETTGRARSFARETPRPCPGMPRSQPGDSSRSAASHQRHPLSLSRGPPEASLRPLIGVTSLYTPAYTLALPSCQGHDTLNEPLAASIVPSVPY